MLVYDLGGGTFDVTVMETSPSIIRAVSTSGSRDLGGADCGRRPARPAARRLPRAAPGRPRPEHGRGGPRRARPRRRGDEEGAHQARATPRRASSPTAGAPPWRSPARPSRSTRRTSSSRRCTTWTWSSPPRARRGSTRSTRSSSSAACPACPMIAKALTERLAGKVPTVPVPRLVDPDQIVAKGAALFAADQRRRELRRRRPGPAGRRGAAPRRPVPLRLVDVTSRGYGIRAPTAAATTRSATSPGSSSRNPRAAGEPHPAVPDAVSTARPVSTSSSTSRRRTSSARISDANTN